MARQAIRLTPEITWGTYNAAGTPITLQIDQAMFDMRPQPNFWTIRSAGGYNKRVQAGNETTGLNGGLSILLYGSQAPTLIPWAFTPNLALTAMPSMTIDHLIQMEDVSNTFIYRRYLGVVVSQVQLQAQAAQPPLVRLNLTLIGKQPATITSSDFPPPPYSDYPTDAPYVFQHLSGGLIFNGISRAEFESFNLTVRHFLDPRFNESRYPTRIRWCGRDVDWTFRNVYQNAGDRPLYEASTKLACQATFTNGAHSMAFDFKTVNYIMPGLRDDLPLERVHYQEINMQSHYDFAAATDFSLTVT